MVYRFVGREAEVGGTSLWFGDKITLSDSNAAHTILGAGAEAGFAGAVALLPEEQFEKLKFTDEELKEYRTPTSRDVVMQSSSVASADIKSKLRAAIEAGNEYRHKVESLHARAQKAAENKTKTKDGD